MGIPLYRSHSARRREAEQAAAQQDDLRHARTGAPVSFLRREDAQRLFSQTPSTASTGTQEHLIDLTRFSLDGQSQPRPAPPPNQEAPTPSTEDGESGSDDAASAVLSNYSRTRYEFSELDTPAEEEELRLPDYGTHNVDWSTPEIDGTSTPSRTPRSSPLRVLQSSPPRAARSSPPAPEQLQQHQNRSGPEAGLPQARPQQQMRQANGARGGFVQVVVDESRGPVLQMTGSPGQAIPPSRRLPALPALPRPADATIHASRHNRYGQSSMSNSSASTSGYETDTSGSLSSSSLSRHRSEN